VVWLRRSIEANRNFPLAHFHLAEVLALLGQLEEAWAAAQAGLALQPDFSLRRYRENALCDNAGLSRRPGAQLRGNAPGRCARRLKTKTGFSRASQVHLQNKSQFSQSLGMPQGACWQR
jgi:hypothetical protein